MKRFALLPVLGLFLLLIGCGKSQDEQRKEAELYDVTMKAHMAQMTTMKQAEALSADIDGAMAKHDSLMKANPKAAATHGTDDLKMAKDKLTAATSAMSSWMAGFKPYDKTAPHEQVMTLLQKESEELVKIGAGMDAAIADATAALDTHKKAAEDLMAAKKPKGRK